jgi:HlyD family secretion protein
MSDPSRQANVSTTNLRDELAALRIDRSRATRPSRRRTVLLVGIAAVLLMGGAIALYAAFRDRLVPLPEVRTEAVRVMSLSRAETVLTATGYLESRSQAAVGAKSPGRVAQILVEEGSKVKQGDLLAVLEHADLDAVLESRKVQVRQAEAMLAEAKNTLQQKERDLAREQAVHERGAGTDAALEAADTDHLTASARFDALAASVALAKAQAREAEEAVRNMHVYAPFAGTIVTKDAEVGETIMPGGMGVASGRGSVATLADLDKLEVDTDVKEDFLGQLRRGQPADVIVDAAPDRHYHGRLREIIPMGDRTRGIVKVKVTILDADERLFPELSATVHFLPLATDQSADSAAKTIFVPKAAIVTTDDDTFVWRLDGDRVHRVPIAPRGEPKNDMVAVQGGLAGGETVVVHPAADLADNARVRVAE